MKRHSPAAERNKAPIFEVLNPLLPVNGRVLEIASGTGQHADYFCQHRPDLLWQASDPDPESLASIQAFHQENRATGMRDPVLWSVFEERPAVFSENFEALVNINMIHISPWEACLALMNHAVSLVPDQGLLFFYGPFFVKDRVTAPSNLAFHQSLQERNSQWGLRDLDQVVAEARERRFTLERVVEMPANNLAVMFRKNLHSKS